MLQSNKQQDIEERGGGGGRGGFACCVRVRGPTIHIQAGSRLRECPYTRSSTMVLYCTVQGRLEVGNDGASPSEKQDLDRGV